MRVDHHLVLKYCEALDEFVRIRVFGEEEGRHIIGGAANANKSAFQHAVVKACVLDHNPDLTTRIERAQRHTSQDLNEILYILCVEVNPSFEIHQVSVPLGDATSGATTDGSIDSTPKLTDEQLDKLMPTQLKRSHSSACGAHGRVDFIELDEKALSRYRMR